MDIYYGREKKKSARGIALSLSVFGSIILTLCLARRAAGAATDVVAQVRQRVPHGMADFYKTGAVAAQAGFRQPRNRQPQNGRGRLRGEQGVVTGGQGGLRHIRILPLLLMDGECRTCFRKISVFSRQTRMLADKQLRSVQVGPTVKLASARMVA